MRTLIICVLAVGLAQAHVSLAAAAIALGTTAVVEAPTAGTDSVVLAVNPTTATWLATTNAPWLHLTVANQGGTGSTNVIFSFDANPGATRVGTLTIAGQTLTVTQAGSTYVVAPGPVTALVSSGSAGVVPYGVAVDGAGNVYFADYGNNAIKEWTATNNSITTLVSSGLSRPYAVAVDGADNVYIADTINNAIKEWTVANSNVTTLVASGLNSPRGVAVDGAGNVYIADTGNNAVKEWRVANSNVTTLVSSGLSGPAGVAVDCAGNVYIADRANHAIKQWTDANSNLTTLVSLGTDSPYAVAVDGAGNVYIADYSANPTIKQWNAASSNLTSLVSSGLSDPYGVAVDGAGNVIFSDNVNDTIKELPRAFVDPTAKAEGAAAGSDALPVVLPATESLLAPFAPASDQSWLTLTGITNGIVSYAFSATPGLNRAGNINLLGVDIPVIQYQVPPAPFVLGTPGLTEGPAAGTDSVVLAASPATLAWTATPNAAWLHLNGANQGGAGSTNVSFSYDANPGGTRVGTLTIAGQTLTVTQAGATYVVAPGPGTTLVGSGLSSTMGVAVDAAGNVYLADSGHSAIKEWTAAKSNVITLVSSGISSLGGIAVDMAGNVYFADSGNNAIKEWTVANSNVITLISSGLASPYGVALDGMGYVYIADSGHNAIKKFPAGSTNLTTLVSSGLSSPKGVAVDRAGNIYIADSGNNAIKRRSATQTNVTTVASMANALTEGYGVAVDGAGNVYFDDGNLEKWNAANGNISALVSSVAPPSNIAVDGSGNVIFTYPHNNSIQELPHAFVDSTPKAEGVAAGSDVLPVVLPVTEDLLAPFTPTSNQSWLTITGIGSGAVNFAFTATIANRTADITLLGLTIPVTQYLIPPSAYSLGTTSLLEGPAAGTDSVVLATVPATARWAAAANAAWLHLNAASQSGTGSTNVIFTYDANPGATRVGTLTLAGQTLTVTQAGATYVAVSAVTTLVSSGLDEPGDVAVDGAGNVYIADTADHMVKEWNVTNDSVSTLIPSGFYLSPTSLAVDAAGNIILGDQASDSVLKWTAASNALTTLVVAGYPIGDMAVDNVGNIYFADSYSGNVSECLVGTTNIKTLASGLNWPIGVAVDCAGNVYFAVNGNGAASSVNLWTAANNTVTSLVSSGLNQPYGVAVDGSGNVFIADNANNAIKEWVAANNTVTTVISSGLALPHGVAVDAAGNLYIADTYNYNNWIKELPRAFVDPTAKSEAASAGTDVLPVVLPATENLLAPFAPASDQLWLAITSTTNGVVNFAFTQNTGSSNRTANITLLGQTIAITQAAPVTPPALIGATILGNGSFQFAFSNLNAGASFSVWSATNLSLPPTNWTWVGTPANIAPGLFQFTTLVATNDPQRFYRVSAP